MVDVAPARERWITPHALLGATSTASSSLTTAGLLAGPAGVATVSAAGVLAAGGVAAVRKFAPGAAKKLGLKKADGKQTDKKAKGDKSKGGGLGRLGLLGAAGRKKAAAGAGSAGGGKRGAGLLGAARKVAGKGAQLAGRAAAAAGKKGAGLLGSKRDAASRSRKADGAGLMGGKKPAGTGKSGSGKANTGKTPAGKKPAGTKNSDTKGTKGSGGKDAGGKGLGGRLLGGAGRLIGRGVKNVLTGPPGGTNEPDATKQPKKPKGAKGSGLLGGDKDHTKKNKPDKTKTPQKNRPGGRDTREAITSGKPDRDRSRRAGGAAMPNPFEGRRDAIAGAAPLEIGRANDLIDYVNHAPDYAETQALRWHAEAEAIVAQIDITPEFAESLKGFASAQMRQVEAVREYGETFRRGHEERLAKLKRKDPREAQWDIDRNR